MFPRQIKNLYPVWLPALPSTSKTHTGFRFFVFCLFNDVGGTGVDFSQNYVCNISLLYKPIKLNISMAVSYCGKLENGSHEVNFHIKVWKSSATET